jgi:NAD(P)-dependent dehydrogenase (short-subunit alcohol dehydrogenase family)
MTTTFDFSGRRAFVTGASSGIGRAVAVQLAQSGAVGDGNRAATSAALDALHAEAGCTPLVIDVGDAAALERALAPLPAFDLVVNCAGIALLESALDLQAESFDAVMAVNARAAALVASRCGKAMIAAGVRGSIVNVSSQAALVALDAHLCYCASKAAMDAITRSLCLEFGPHGIRVNSVNPTVTLTPMAEAGLGRSGQERSGLEEHSDGKVCRGPGGGRTDPLPAVRWRVDGQRRGAAGRRGLHDRLSPIRLQAKRVPPFGESSSASRLREIFCSICSLKLLNKKPSVASSLKVSAVTSTVPSMPGRLNCATSQVLPSV